MKAVEILAWAEVGAKLVTILKVPLASVLQLFKDSGGTDDEASALVGYWHSLTASIEARIAELKAKG